MPVYTVCYFWLETMVFIRIKSDFHGMKAEGGRMVKECDFETGKILENSNFVFMSYGHY